MTDMSDPQDKLERIHRHWQDAASAASELVRYDQIRVVLDHWISLWADGGLPRRDRLDPTRIGSALAHVYIMDYEAEARALRYRLIGEQVRSRYAKPIKGKLLSEIVEPSAYPAVSSYFLACPELPAITMLTGRLYQEREMPAFGQRLLVPLLDAQGRGQALLGLTLSRQTYDSLNDAIVNAKRRVSIFPLDGTDPTDTVS